MDSAPLCLVWVARADDHTNVVSRVYRSFDLPKMLNLAYRLASERNLIVSVLSADPFIEEMHTMVPAKSG